jgi:hypothetical protein
MTIFMAFSFRHHAVVERAYSVPEVVARDEAQDSASSSLGGWTGRVGWTHADRNFLLYCHRRVAQAGGPEMGASQVV